MIENFFSFPLLCSAHIHKAIITSCYSIETTTLVKRESSFNFMPHIQHISKSFPFFILSRACNLRLIAVDMFQCFVIKSLSFPCHWIWILNILWFVFIYFEISWMLGLIRCEYNQFIELCEGKCCWLGITIDVESHKISNLIFLRG